MRIDLNSDLGEGFGPYIIADDAGIMDIITSANLACGYHAGDPVIMDRTIGLAKAAGVDIGAHVGYPDRMGFGRRPMSMDLAELEKHVIYQLGALEGLARPYGRKISHMNPHGALGNLACADRAVADALVRAISAFDPEIAYLVLTGTELETAARSAGRQTINLFLADRAYLANGQLAPRNLPGAVIKDSKTSTERIMRLLDDGTLVTIDGQILRIEVQSILVHSDTPGAIEMARAIRSAITGAGGVITPLSELLQQS
ncbi:3-beta hydroxysteroid dehydrogenase/isomerase [Devosia yakushimensis]|uniref:5-oxoprolinase subunit A n=1 Tax=Devosia yakushimensis TaxID=470028 RepID=A0ABQ5UDU1_9HYPH|nr:5-oxoprolinase subunit PxpA [Devosia yakushimensis]GLQ09905.1 3-beta hydroxysteroid dehydrogenase/isomerase [Devosia yakushimensis]